MRKFSILIFSLCVCLGLTTVEPPIWPEHFSQSFEVDTGYSYMTGRAWYDFERGDSRLDFDHADGRVCQIYSEYDNSKCTQLYVGEMVYFILPQEELCCYGNNSDVFQRDWLRNGDYIFTGQVELNGQSFYRWQHYNFTYIEYLADKSIRMVPRRNALQKIIFDYWIETYSEDQISASVFNIPSYCKQECVWHQQRDQKLSIISNLRQRKSLDTQ